MALLAIRTHIWIIDMTRFGKGAVVEIKELRAQ
jgi:hypothetical protein